jgi:hypothetical protein
MAVLLGGFVVWYDDEIAELFWVLQFASEVLVRGVSSGVTRVGICCHLLSSPVNMQSNEMSRLRRKPIGMCTYRLDL